MAGAVKVIAPGVTATRTGHLPRGGGPAEVARIDVDGKPAGAVWMRLHPGGPDEAVVVDSSLMYFCCGKETSAFDDDIEQLAQHVRAGCSGGGMDFGGRLNPPGIRPYGPGKFNTLVDSWVYAVGADRGFARVIGGGPDGGWFGLLRFSGGAERAIRVAAATAGESLNAAEATLIADTSGVVVFENESGFVTVDYCASYDELDAAWAEAEQAVAEEEIINEEAAAQAEDARSAADPAEWDWDDERKNPRCAHEARYTTSYCNRAHCRDCGVPVGHECRVLDPNAIRAERRGDYETANRLLGDDRRAAYMRRGIRRRP